MTSAAPQEPLTVGQAVDLYLETLSRGRKEASQRLGAFVRWCGRDSRLRSLTHADVANYSALLPSGPEGKKQAEALKDFLAFARARGFIDEDLRASLRLPRASRRSPFPNPPAGSQPVVLTPDGRAKLEQRLRVLQEELLRTSEEIRQAAADKDVRENAPLEAARERYGFLASQIREIEEVLARSQVVAPSSSKARAHLGSRVTLKDLNSGREVTYLLVSPQEANPLESKVSIASPVGQALLDREEGDEVQIRAPRGLFTYRLLRVE